MELKVGPDQVKAFETALNRIHYMELKVNSQSITHHPRQAERNPLHGVERSIICHHP